MKKYDEALRYYLSKDLRVDNFTIDLHSAKIGKNT